MNIKNLTMSYGTKKLYNDINLIIKENEKVGLIGPNGAGKTTLFKIIMNIENPDHGKIIFKPGTRINWLPQVIENDLTTTNIDVFTYLLNARPIEKLTKELEKYYQKVANTKNEKEQTKIFNKIDKTQKKLEYYNYLSAENELLKIISGMKLEDLLDKKIKELSGGQKSKVAFAKLLYSVPEVILLDEPTNHLDKETKEYVTNYLKNYQGSIYIISHDIDFLNKIITKTLYLNPQEKTLKLYNGNYNTFQKLLNEEEKTKINQAKIEQEEIKHLTNFINKYKSSTGKRKKVVQDREKKLNKLLKNQTKKEKQKEAKIEMQTLKESTKYPLKIKNLSFDYNKNSKKQLINNLNLTLTRGEKFLITGKNGVGKSTLLKLIIGKLTPSEGEIEIGKKTIIGYYAQEHELLENNKTIIENFNDLNIQENKLRSILGSFIFTGDEIYKKVNVLSPGEKSRVALAKLSLTNANLLILDEPTNHLDPKTQKLIAQTFKNYKGTMLVVSHNKEFINNLGIERTLELPKGKISYYDQQTPKYCEEINQKH